jgi:hypothetical protein
VVAAIRRLIDESASGGPAQGGSGRGPDAKRSMASPVVDGAATQRAANNSTSVFKGVLKEAPPIGDMDGADAIKPPWRHHRRGCGRRHRRRSLTESC